MKDLVLGLVAVIGGAGLLALTILLAVSAGAIFGGLGGWVVGMLFPSMMAKLVALTPFAAPYQLGAALGFVGGFLKSHVTQNAKK